MKKLIAILVGLMGLAITSNANIIAKTGTWQMAGFGVDVNLSKISYPPKENFSIMWMYNVQTKKWKAFSKDDATKQLIKDDNLWSDSLKKEDAFWIKAKKDTPFFSFSSALQALPTKAGWHLVSFGYGWWNIAHYFDNIPTIKGAFAYRNNHWRYLYRTDSGYVGDLKHFDNGEGGWIYLSSDVNASSNPPLAYIDYGYDDIDEHFTFVNKKVTFSNGTEIILDQNGSVTTNDANLSQYSTWRVRYNGYQNKSFRLYNTNGTKQLDFLLSNNGNGSSYALTKTRYETRKFYPNHTMDINDMNYTSEQDSNITVTFNDYNKSHTKNSTVKDAMDSINNLLENGDEDANSTLQTAKSNLQNINNNDAKVALAIVNLIETLDEPIVSSVFDINSDDLNLENFFKPVVYTDNLEEVLKLKDSISDYSGDAKDLLALLATRLTSSADELKPIYQDKNYVFDYSALGEKKLNFVDIKVLRAALMAVAFKLQFYASYDLGDNTWDDITTDGNIEYRKISADTVGFLNSGTFLVNPSQESLTKAKTDLVTFLGIYEELLNAPQDQREGLAISYGNIVQRNIKRDVHLALKNLTDNTDYPYFVYRDDWVSQNYQGKKSLKQRTFTYNLNALFLKDKTITINDFPPFIYKNGTYDANTSKINGYPVDSNYKDLDIGTKINFLFSQTNKINNIYIKYTDENNQSYEGVELLNELFR